MFNVVVRIPLIGRNGREDAHLEDNGSQLEAPAPSTETAPVPQTMEGTVSVATVGGQAASFEGPFPPVEISSGSINSPRFDCPICCEQEDLSIATDLSHIHVFPCGHRIHLECLENCVRSNGPTDCISCGARLGRHQEVAPQQMQLVEDNRVPRCRLRFLQWERQKKVECLRSTIAMATCLAGGHWIGGFCVPGHEGSLLIVDCLMSAGVCYICHDNP